VNDSNSVSTATPFSFGQWFLILTMAAYSVGNLWLYVSIETISNGWATLLTYGNIGSYVIFGMVFVTVCLQSWARSPLLVFGVAFLSIMVAGFGVVSNFELAGELATIPTNKLENHLYLLIGNATIAIPGLCFAIMLFRIINDDAQYTDFVEIEN